MDKAKEIVVDVDFYMHGQVPEKIVENARAWKTIFVAPRLETSSPRIVCVKTVFVMEEPVRIKYVIDDVGRTPAEIKAYMHKLAKEDGCDLNQAVKRAFGED